MTRRALLACVLAAACGRPRETTSGTTGPIATPVAEGSAPIPAEFPVVANQRCPDIVKGDAARIAARWPTMIGQRVRLRMRIERAVDFTLSMGVSDGRRFAIVLSPDAVWSGEIAKTFTVMGSRSLRVGGRAQLPELLLDDTGVCP